MADDYVIGVGTVGAGLWLGYADDFPGAALFYVSPASAWITGTCLRVDGGVARQLGL